MQKGFQACQSSRMWSQGVTNFRHHVLPDLVMDIFGDTMQDIDECRTGTPCGDLMCVNTIGSYECICPNGFTHDDGLRWVFLALIGSLTSYLYLIGLNFFSAVEILMNVPKPTTVDFTAVPTSPEDIFVNVLWTHYGILSGWFTKTAPWMAIFGPDTESFFILE